MSTTVEQRTGPSRGWTACWLVVVAALHAAVGYAAYRVFVTSTKGQLVEAAALDGSQIGRERLAEQMNSVLNVVSMLSVLVAAVVVVFIALVRRRVALALMGGVVIVAANVTTQALKYVVLGRPDLGVESAGSVENTLPSGHTTVAASVACALILVVPRQIRGTVAIVGTAYAALTGTATLVVGWHRPSDVIVAYLVVGGWAAAVGAVLAVLPSRTPVDGRSGHPVLTTLLLLAAAAALALGGLAIWRTVGLVPNGWEQLGRGSLFVAYAGGVAAALGTCAAVMGLFVATIGRVAPTPSAATRG